MTESRTTDYHLECQGCRSGFPDDGTVLNCPACGNDALLAAEYATPHFTVDHSVDGAFRYHPWLPVRAAVGRSHVPAVYRSTGLARLIGLNELWISFAGWWPERATRFPTGTFKDLEAQAVLARKDRRDDVLVVASAGNTAAAFAAACSTAGQQCLLHVPPGGLRALASVSYDTALVKVVVSEGSYDDAIDLAAQLTARVPRLVREGGVRNIARRAGLGVVMMAAYEQLGTLPDFYFQAVGSAAGALGCHEVARRIAGPGRTPRMMLCQNSNRSALGRLWQPDPHRGADSEPEPGSGAAAFALELLNGNPPYAVHGGIRQMLTASAGDVLLAGARAAARAAAAFEWAEGIDVEPAAAVATACLWQAVRDGRVPRDASVLLNVTGGGRRGMPEPAGHARPVDLRVSPGTDISLVVDDILRLTDELVP